MIRVLGAYILYFNALVMLLLLIKGIKKGVFDNEENE